MNCKIWISSQAFTLLEQNQFSEHFSMQHCMFPLEINLHYCSFTFNCFYIRTVSCRHKLSIWIPRYDCAIIKVEFQSHNATEPLTWKERYKVSAQYISTAVKSQSHCSFLLGHSCLMFTMVWWEHMHTTIPILGEMGEFLFLLNLQFDEPRSFSLCCVLSMHEQNFTKHRNEFYALLVLL